MMKQTRRVSEIVLHYYSSLILDLSRHVAEGAFPHSSHATMQCCRQSKARQWDHLKAYDARGPLQGLTWCPSPPRFFASFYLNFCPTCPMSLPG